MMSCKFLTVIDELFSSLWKQAGYELHQKFDLVIFLLPPLIAAEFEGNL